MPADDRLEGDFVMPWFRFGLDLEFVHYRGEVVADGFEGEFCGGVGWFVFGDAPETDEFVLRTAY